MTKKDYSDTIEFMRVALTRNDDSIRFSEGKAGFLFSFTGLIIGLFLNEITVFKPLLLSKGFLGTMAFVSLTLIIIGVIVVIIATFMVITPRLNVTKELSLLYFGYIQSISEQNLSEIVVKLDSTTALRNLTTQVHATSVIVAKKFYFVSIEIFGAILVFIGWLLATILIFYIS